MTETTVNCLACFFFDAIERSSKEKLLGIINIPMATILKARVKHDCGQALTRIMNLISQHDTAMIAHRQTINAKCLLVM